MGSELPGGYSTVIIKPSLPGRLRSFDISSVTFASCANSTLDVRHITANIAFVNDISCLSRPHRGKWFRLAITLLLESATRAGLARFRNASRPVVRPYPEPVSGH